MLAITYWIYYVNWFAVKKVLTYFDDYDTIQANVVGGVNMNDKIPVVQIDCSRKKVGEGIAEFLISYFPTLQIMSPQSMREILNGALEMGMEIADGREKSRLAKNITYLKVVADEYLLGYFVEVVLRFSGLSRLTGFGFATRFGDKLYGNPERSSYINLGGSK